MLRRQQLLSCTDLTCVLMQLFEAEDKYTALEEAFTTQVTQQRRG